LYFVTTGTPDGFLHNANVFGVQIAIIVTIAVGILGRSLAARALMFVVVAPVSARFARTARRCRGPHPSRTRLEDHEARFPG
jgi:hypothetical protein